MCYIDEEHKIKPEQSLQTNPEQQVIAGQHGEELRLQREELEQRRAHIWNVTEQYPIQMPKMSISNKGEISVEGKTYAKKSKESISAGKRKCFQKLSLSSLYDREKRAESVEQAESDWLKSREEIKEKNPELLRGYYEEKDETQNQNVLETDWEVHVDPFEELELEQARRAKEGEVLAQFWSENEEQNQRLLGEKWKQECIEQFMELDLSLDLRTDELFAAASPKMEEIFRKSEAFFYLYETKPDFANYLSSDEKKQQQLEYKMNQVRTFTNYYQIRKKVITNPYYRSHYHSEISYYYHETDTKEQKNLTTLLWQLERLQELKERFDLEKAPNLFQDKEQLSKEEIKDTQKARETLGEISLIKNVERPIWNRIPRTDDENYETELRSIKEDMTRHFHYMKRKYGNAIPLLSLEELRTHQDELSIDFANTEQYTDSLIARLETIGLFDRNREEDLELQRLMTYYNKCTDCLRRAKDKFKDDTRMSYSDYKKWAAMKSVDHFFDNDNYWKEKGQEIADIVSMNNSMNLNVDWNATYDE